MLPILVLASLAVLCHSTVVDLYKPAIYSNIAPVYAHAAPIKYVAPVLIKEAPKPYSFGYHAPAIGGASSRHETSDGFGRVVGSYTVADIDGRLRVVDYYADETGFHANVNTNEPGTSNENSADVSVQSYAAPVIAPVVAPKIVAAPAVVAPVVSPKLLAASAVIAPVPVYAKRLVAPLPVTYNAIPAYKTLSHRPIVYSHY